MKNAVFVDFDNTLHKSDVKFHKSLEGLFGLDGKTLWDLFHINIHREIVHKRYPDRYYDVDLHMRLLFQFLDIPYDKLKAEEFLKRYYKAERECWESPEYFDDTFPFLNGLKELSAVVCLTTGPYPKEKALGIEHHGSRKYFDYTFGEDILGYSKTDPKYYIEALMKADSTPEKTVSIGDTLSHDVISAKKVGIRTIWLNRTRVKKPSGIEPDYEVVNLLEALEIIKLICRNLP